jgi:ketosteroid isomerase-like protein
MTADARAIATKLYGAFVRKDGATMASLYANDATFSDEVFVDLTGLDAGKMWRMLCTSKDLKVTYEILECTKDVARIKWQAHYLFSKTGRPVHNIIDATITVADGKIRSHTDKFPFWKWSAQALGPIGLILGWSPIIKNMVRQQAKARLQAFAS